MNIQQISQDFFITSQINPAQLQQIADQGFRSIICNRPDGEEAGQPSFTAVQAAARAIGIEIRHVPIVHGAVGPAEHAAFDAALKALPFPTLGYCKSGMRAANMYGAVKQTAA